MSGIARIMTFSVSVSSLMLISQACGGGGGPVSGAADTHCGTKKVTVNQASCLAPPDAGSDMPDYGETRYNAEADDDDCKYHVKWTSTPIAQNSNVTFTATITTSADGKPAKGAETDLEAFLSDTHPAPNSGAKTKETSDGVYSTGPMRFDKPGQWTVRFHVHEECHDAEDSPHGHVGFYVSVP